MEMLDHAIFSCLAPFLSYHLMPRGRKNHLNMATFVYADGGNQTQAASAASERGIHYTIAPWPATFR